MKALSEVTKEEFQQVLTDANVRTLRIIHLAIAAGVVMFGGVVAFLYAGQHPIPAAQEEDVQMIQMMSVAHLFIAFSAYTAANFVFNAQFKDEKTAVRTENPADGALGLIRTALIIRLAMYEAPALFGLVVCLLAVLNGVLYVEPLFALNLLTMFILLGLVVNTLPGKERLEALFATHIHS